MSNEEPKPSTSKASGDSKVQSGPSRMQIHQYEQYPDEDGSKVGKKKKRVIKVHPYNITVEAIKSGTPGATDLSFKKNLVSDDKAHEIGDRSNVVLDNNEAAGTQPIHDEVSDNSAPKSGGNEDSAFTKEADMKVSQEIAEKIVNLVNPSIFNNCKAEVMRYRREN